MAVIFTDYFWIRNDLIWRAQKCMFSCSFCTLIVHPPYFISENCIIWFCHFLNGFKPKLLSNEEVLGPPSWLRPFKYENKSLWGSAGQNARPSCIYLPSATKYICFDKNIRIHNSHPSARRQWPELATKMSLKTIIEKYQLDNLEFFSHNFWKKTSEGSTKIWPTPE